MDNAQPLYYLKPKWKGKVIVYVYSTASTDLLNDCVPLHLRYLLYFPNYLITHFNHLTQERQSPITHMEAID